MLCETSALIIHLARGPAHKVLLVLSTTRWGTCAARRRARPSDGLESRSSENEARVQTVARDIPKRQLTALTDCPSNANATGQLRSPDAAGLVQARSGSVNNVLSRIGSIPRVASLDFWRDIVLKGTTSFANLATVGSGLSAYNAATSLSAGEPAVEVKAAADNGVMPPPATRGRRSSVKAAEAEEVRLGVTTHPAVTEQSESESGDGGYCD